MYIKKGVGRAVNKHTARFFMPGHKGMLHPLDVTELPGTDNLHRPEGIIQSAQQFAAKAVGAQHTLFSVGGSTAGLHGLILSLCSRGDTLIVDRSCHISVINILTMMDITPVFVSPVHNSAFGISSGIEADAVAAALKSHPQAKGVLITSPTYYGVCSNVKAIAQAAHDAGVPLLVDEAHGAHLPFHPALPASALACGADGVVQSAHKTLPCLTQGAMVHVNSNRISLRSLQEHMAMVQSTSPSYLLMSSIEESVAHMARRGRTELGRLIERCNRLRQVLNQTGAFVCLDSSNCGGFAYDPTRLVIHVPGGTGAISRTLQERFNIMLEMDDGYNLVCIPTPFNRPGDFVRLKRALVTLSSKLPPAQPGAIPPLPVAPLAMPPHAAFYSPTAVVPAGDAIGKIAARSVYKTPPCMPILCPGERITPAIAARLTGQITIVK